eukprot:15466650-Alexandrium_andersonii.AAC.1
MQSPYQDGGYGDHRNEPNSIVAKPPLAAAFVRGSPRPSSGQRGSACSTSAWQKRDRGPPQATCRPYSHRA